MALSFADEKALESEPRHVRILGTRGIPARHGGFETFAERLSLYLVEKGWKVTVYCQAEDDQPVDEAIWNGVRLIRIPVRSKGAIGTVEFDWASTVHAARERGVVLTLGYNTALFALVLRATRQTNLINMDGIEWKRAKWSIAQRAWLYVNERLGCWLGNHLIADHPEIARHLETRVAGDKITMIPYGGDQPAVAGAKDLTSLGINPFQYALVIARPEPENSLLEIVQAFSMRPRGMPLVVLGAYSPDNEFHHLVKSSASSEVLFPGAIYDSHVVAALRRYTALYIHGHQVGGTNPSLVEALGAGSPVLAHKNRYNQWVVGQGGHYFASVEECAMQMDALLADPEELDRMRAQSLSRYQDQFVWSNVLRQYEDLLARWSEAR